MSRKKQTRNVHMQLSQHVVDLLDKIAEETGTNRTAVVELVVRKHYKHFEKEFV